MSELVIDANYSADTEGTSKDVGGTTEVIGDISGAGELRTVVRFPITGLSAADTITAVEFRGYYSELGSAGAPGTIYAHRYGTSHGENDPNTDSAANMFARAKGDVQYAATAWPALNNYTTYLSLGATAITDLEWCLDNSATIFSIGLVEDGYTDRGDNFYRAISGYDQTNKPQLRVTYTVGGGSSAKSYAKFSRAMSLGMRRHVFRKAR
jgi:hypothetical protein